MGRAFIAKVSIVALLWTSTLSAECIDVIKDFKAACDGKTDDSLQLQAAVNAAETILYNNSVACVFVTPGRTCSYSTTLEVLNFEQQFGPGSLSIYSLGDGAMMYGGGILSYTGTGNAIEVDNSGVGNGLAFALYGLTVTCPGNECGALVNIGKAFGPITIHNNYMDGMHNSVSSGGASDGVVCNNCAIQVQIENNHIFNMRHSAVTVLRGTNITVSGNQLFDTPYGVYLAGAGPVSIDHNYFEQIEDGIKLSNDEYWTYNLLDIYDNEFNLKKLPPYSGGADTGGQRCLLIANDASSLSMGLKVHFHDNKCDESDGYVFGNPGHAPYGVELGLNESLWFTADVDVENNFFAGMTVSAIYSNSSRANVTYGKNYASSSYPADGYGNPIPEFSGAQSHSLPQGGHNFIKLPAAIQRSVPPAGDSTQGVGSSSDPPAQCKDSGSRCDRSR